jgi:hypothetical protein
MSIKSNDFSHFAVQNHHHAAASNSGKPTVGLPPAVRPD